ncbi:MAG: cytochrome b N-terminal domain-containing protein [Humidesulfovibrio sp.]|nr:cytochrome b N-terminal domain-containing protein [Humidesulfovibrio sp.]
MRKMPTFRRFLLTAAAITVFAIVPGRTLAANPASGDMKMDAPAAQAKDASMAGMESSVPAAKQIKTAPAAKPAHQQAAETHNATEAEHAPQGAVAQDAHEEPAMEGMDMGGSEQHGANAGHGHGVPGVGYIGLAKREGAIDPVQLKDFKERVSTEAMSKGKLDQVRFAFFALTFLLAYLAYAKIEKLEPITRKLRAAIDWHALGTLTGIILCALVIPSGIIITFFFMPTSTGVYASVEAMTANHALAFFRNLHNWSSEVFIWLMLLHAARTISTHTFLGKRKFIWLTGAVASAVAWVAFLSGSFMRGDQEAIEGFEHMMFSFGLFPGGSAISQFFSGELTLIRLTTLHVIATIFIMAVFIAMHVLMRKVHVQVESRWRTATRYSVVLTLLLSVQSGLMEAPFVRGLANIPTLSGIEYTKPPWPIYFLIQGENWFGANAMVMILTATFVPLIILPYVVELLPLSDQRKRLVGEGAFYAGVFGLLLVSFIAAGGKIIAHIF